MPLVTFKDAEGARLGAGEHSTLGELRRAQPESILVFKGRILVLPGDGNDDEDEDDSQSLDVTFADCRRPIVYVVKCRPATSPPPPTTPPTTAAQEEEEAQDSPTPTTTTGRCRICYGEEHTLWDPLFRPCLCRGSMALVHRDCLNAWRERPENPTAFTHCVNCGFQYRVQRVGLLDGLVASLDANQFAIGFTVAFLFAIVSVVALASYVLVPVGLANQVLLHTVDWFPPNELARHYALALGAVGVGGFLLHLNDVVRQIQQQRGSLQHLFAVGLMMASNGGRVVRVFCLSGLSVAFHLLFTRCQVWSRRLFTRLGERIVPVDAY